MKRDHSSVPLMGSAPNTRWSGNGKAGEGTMEDPGGFSTRGVKIDLRFIRPFKNDCITHFHFTPQGNATTVRWTMDGPNLFMGKVMGVFLNMDKMIGKDFENGLAELKTQVEKH
jgi:hypothetical protein